MSDAVDETKKKLATEAGKAALESAVADAKEKVAGASTTTKLKIIGGIVGVAVIAISVMALIAKLWMYAIGLLIVGGIGFATYLVVKPKVLAMKEQAEAKLLAGAREREEQERVQAAANAEAAAKKKLDDELAALKAKSSG